MADATPLQPRVLVVDRDLPETRTLLAFLEAPGGMKVVWARDGEAAIRILDEKDEPVHALVADLKAQRIDGMRLLREARSRYPELCAVLISRRPDLAAATAAVREGAADFQAKPINLEKLLATLRQGVSRQELRIQVDELRERLSERFRLERLSGRSPAIVELLEQVRQVAGTDAPVLLAGESGTGKTLLAQAIHQNSRRQAGPFVSVQCTGMAEPVLEEELFGGAERGREAVRGHAAARGHEGRLQLAAEGTLFVDHISELPPRIQTRLMTRLRDRVPEGGGDGGTGSAGGASAMPRLILATERDLADLVRRGKFRDDLYYALASAVLTVPTLRDRREDLPLLVQSLLTELNQEHGRQVTGVTRGCMDLLMRYTWPGNVRELKSVLEGVVLFVEGRRPLEAGDLPEYLRDRPPVPQDFRVRVGMSLAEVERRAIQETLTACGGRKPEAARMLGIGLRTLYRKIQEYELG